MWIGYGLSLASVALLGWLDPKRKRSLRGNTAARWTRRATAVLLLLLGCVYATTGQTAAFVVWIGVVSVAGWLMAWLLNRGVKSS